MDRLILLASDHNGVEARLFLKPVLRSEGYHCVDFGPYGKNPVDYTDYAQQIARAVSDHEALLKPLGILICGTGAGMSIAANKVIGARAVLVHNMDTATKSREHNDANVLCLGAWINSNGRNVELAEAWLQEKFGEGRHVRRVEKIDSFTNPQGKIVFANGCFDILHAGHISLLRFAKILGDHVVVGLNSDFSVQNLKGQVVNTYNDRKAVLESLKYVDEVLPFDGDIHELIDVISPDIVVKGGDYTADTVRANDKIPDHIQVKIFPIVQDIHTSSIVKHIKEL